jgi:3-oxoacyl-[acyl-carrier-protein] synthase II
VELNRVVITGRGAVSPFGLGVDTLVENIWRGRSAVRPMPAWAGIQGLKSLIAAPVPDFDGKGLIPRNLRRTMGLMAQYATIAAQEAVADASLNRDLLTSGMTGVAIGSTTGSPQTYQDFYQSFLPKMAMEQIKSGEFFKMMSHSSSANVCLALGIQGEQWAPASACTSSAHAIGLGYLLIKMGRQQVMLCGGTEEVHPTVTGVFDLIKAASCRNDEATRTPRPFDRNRDGVVCGGGSGILVLEEYLSAKKRGARIYAEIIGFGNVNDHEHIANPHEKAMARAMMNGMQEACVQPEEIDYVSAHATGTEQGDPAEAAAIHRVLGERPPVSSLKGHIGHTLGAAGSLELVILLEMLERQEIIPTLNLEDIDPACTSINLIQNRMKHPLHTIIKNNFALGGVNASLVLRRAES